MSSLISSRIKLFAFASFILLGSAVSGYCDFVSVNVTDLKSPATFYSGKFINNGDLEFTVVSTSTADNLGVEPGWQLAVNLVSASGSCNSASAIANDLSTSTLSDPDGRQVYRPQFYILRSFTGQSVRFQVTVSSVNSTVLGRACSSAIDVFDYESSSMTLLKTDFFTGKNANAAGQTGARVTVVSTSSVAGFGLEPWMAVHVAVVSSAGSGTNSAEVIPTTINMSTNSQNATPVIRPQNVHTGDSVRYQLTITSANSTTALTPRIGSNPSYTSAINIYDFQNTDLQIVQSPPIFVVNSTVNPNGVKLLVVSTDAPSNYGLEDYMRVSIDLVDASNTLIANGVSGISPTLSAGSTFYFPDYYPRYSSGGSQTLKYRVTITSSTITGSTGVTLTPRTGINPSFSTLVGIAPGTASKLVLLPLTDALTRPSVLGRAQQYDSTTPKQWTPTALGENLRVKVQLTDSWSNPVDITPSTRYVTFDPATYLTLPAYNSGSQWLLDSGYNGTSFDFNIVPWEVAVPIMVSSADGFSSDTIYVTKYGLPRETIFAGPSPFNPKTGGTIRFGFRVGTDKTVKILVLDMFGHQVWETSVQATADLMNTSATWDGRNGNNDLVGAGIYWAVLEIDGEWKSKKKFGVVK